MGVSKLLTVRDTGTGMTEEVKAQTSPLALFLSGEERLEYVGLNLLRHARAGVPDGQHHIVPWRQRYVLTRTFRVNGHIDGFDGEFTSVGHGNLLQHR